MYVHVCIFFYFSFATFTLSCLTLMSRLSSNPNESLQAAGTHMLGGKQKFHGQSGFYDDHEGGGDEEGGWASVSS